AGNVGIEPRRGGGSGDQQIVVNFAGPVSAAAGNVVSVTSGTGVVSSVSYSGTQATINLTGVTNAQRLTVTLSNVSDGTNTGGVSIPMGVLLGDVSGDGLTNGGDALQTRARSGQTTDGMNYRFDVNTDGIVSGGDTLIVRGQSGNFLP
ncbi:MAG: dockerin type I domain-containing protein, partial [Chthoniobacterales bacterium]